MVKIGGKTYFIDLGAIGNVISGKEEFKATKVNETETVIYYNEKNEETGRQVHIKEFIKGQEFDAAIYGVVKDLIDIVIIPYENEMDESLGFDRGMLKQPLSFKLAFNTLEHYGILTEEK
jgi:hypothetical protein